MHYPHNIDERLIYLYCVTSNIDNSKIKRNHDKLITLPYLM